MELLGVIIILAIISVIVIPNVVRIIDESKASAVETSAKNYLRAVEQEIINKNIKGNFNPTECVIQSDGNLICDGNIPLTIDAKGRKPSSGTIIIKNKVPVGIKDFVMSGYELNMTENGEVIVKGSSSSWNPGGNTGGENPGSSAITLEKSSVGSNFIVVQANVNNVEIEKIEYSLDDGNTWEEDRTNLTHTFNGLTKNTSYQIKARVTTNKGNIIISKSIPISTKDITEPVYTIDITEAASQKVVTITYPKINGQELTYEYSIDRGSTWKTATQIQEVTFTKNGTIVARVTDGINTVTASTFTVENIIDFLMVNEDVESAETTFLGGTILRSKIESVTAVDNKTIPSNAIGSWDVSEKQNGSIMAWYTDTDNNGLYELYIGAEGKPKANPNSSNLLKYFTNMTSAQLSNLDGSYETTISGFLYNCSSLTNWSFNIGKNVTDFSYLFYGCSGVTTGINISSTFSKVTNAEYMFGECSNITSVNFKNEALDTSKVENMQGMFSGCTKLTTIKGIDKFNTSQVTNMIALFRKCSSLTSLDLSKWNTGNVTSMRMMFIDCVALTTLNISNFNTNNVTDMYGMFQSCKKLVSLNVNSFNTSNVTNMQQMFNACDTLTNLDLSNFDTSKVENMNYMFYSCANLATVDLRKSMFTNITEYTDMFNRSPKLKIIYVKDTTARAFINNRLSDVSKTGVTVTIA